MATRGLLHDLAALYAAHGGATVSFESVGGVDAARRVEDGEKFNLVVLAWGAIDRLVAAGRVAAPHKVDIASSGLGIAVRNGSPRPDVSSEDAVRLTIRQTDSIAFSTGPSGAALSALLQRWGIVEETAPRLVQAPAGTPVAALLARGTAELGFQQVSELLGFSDVVLLGSLPTAVQITTVFSGAQS